MKLTVLSALVAGALALTAIPTPAHAADPVPVITCDTLTVHLGETLHCAVTETAGYTPSTKITWYNPRTRATSNVWNGQNQTIDITYSPSAGEVGRTETLISTIGIPTYPGSRLVRQSVGYVYFTVLGPVTP